MAWVGLKGFVQVRDRNLVWLPIMLQDIDDCSPVLGRNAILITTFGRMVHVLQVACSLQGKASLSQP